MRQRAVPTSEKEETDAKFHASVSFNIGGIFLKIKNGIAMNRFHAYAASLD